MRFPLWEINIRTLTQIIYENHSNISKLNIQITFWLSLEPPFFRTSCVSFFSLPPPLHRGPTSPGCKYSNLEANQLHPPQKTNMTMPLPSMGLVYLCMFTYIYHHIYHLKTTIKFMEVNLPYLDDMGWKIMDTPYFWLVGLNLKSANNYRKLTYPFRTFERFSFPVWWDMLVSSRVYWWFGATTGLGFESGYPSLTIPFIFGDPRDPNNRAPNHQFTITVVDKEKKTCEKKQQGKHGKQKWWTIGQQFLHDWLNFDLRKEQQKMVDKVKWNLSRFLFSIHLHVETLSCSNHLEGSKLSLFSCSRNFSTRPSLTGSEHWNVVFIVTECWHLIIPAKFQIDQANSWPLAIYWMNCPEIQEWLWDMVGLEQKMQASI